MATKKQRAVRIVLAVLSSVVLTALVAVPLALGAHSARNDTGTTTPISTTVRSSSTSSEPTGPGSTGPLSTGPERTIPGNTDDRSTQAPPLVQTEVLPLSETRQDRESSSSGDPSVEDQDSTGTVTTADDRTGEGTD